ncbi:MAG TPA: MEDS domain-containing protein [Terriglobia bacterium]|nr:MEDS domain-containing protein [Terriglobia bacterium]
MQINSAHDTPLLSALEQLTPHQHLCVIYEGPEERFAVAIPFIRFGLDRGENCIYITDDGTEAAVREAMYAGGIDVERAIRTGSLVLKKKETAYLKHGSFDPQWMWSFWSDAAAEAMSQGFSALRATGETEWVVRGAPGVEQWMQYESRVTHTLTQYNCVVLCQYNRQLFPPELTLDVIRTHPLVVCGAVICKNPYYVPPDEFPKPNQASQEVERLLNNILAGERAQQTLRRSEDRLRHIIDTIPTMAWSLRPDGAVDFLNQVWLDYTGLSLQEGLEEPTRVVHPDDLPRVMKKWLADMAAGNPSEDEMRLRRADAEYRWFLVRSLPLRDEGGNIVKWYGSGVDIEDRKRAEEALRRSEAYLAAGQRLSHTGSWALSLSSGELYWSQETYRIFGFDPAETSASVNETFLPRIHPEDRPKVEEGLKAAAIQKESDEVDYRIVLPDGSIKHIRDVVYPVTDEVGEVVERYGVIMDVTERKRTEEELQRSRDQLRALAARLQSVREEERTKVAREIHDELGQALTAIKIDLSSLSRELPADQKPASESILKLVDETIQSVRRISTELRPAILDAVGLVAAVEWAAGDFEGRTGTKCQLDLPQEDIAIDQERATALFRIFQETLTNVVRHANATVVSVRLAKEDSNLTLRVHDNGTGVSEEQLSAGSSLGILGIRERALLLGGELTITGDPGEGTTVRVRIPETIPPKDIK